MELLEFSINRTTLKFFQKKCLFNPYSPNVTYLYPPKTPENPRFSDVSRGHRNVTLGEYGLMISKPIGAPVTGLRPSRITFTNSIFTIE